MTKKWIAPTYGGVDALILTDIDVPAPRRGEVTIAVKAAGMNPSDYKSLSWGGELPLSIGFEVAGVVTAVGPNTKIGSGPVQVGTEVLAFRVFGGYTEELTVPSEKVFAKPSSLRFEEAANLLLAGSTAAEMLHLTHVAAGDTILVHGASGSVGVSVLQQARVLGARAIGTTSAAHAGLVESFGATPVPYGHGLANRVRDLAPDGVVAALDCVGTDEAVEVSLDLVADRRRVVTSSALQQASQEGFRSIGGTAESVAYRDQVRPRLIELAGSGQLTVPIARTFALTDAIQALELLQSGHAGGKLALLPPTGR